jgi:hypothetical protein
MRASLWILHGGGSNVAKKLFDYGFLRWPPTKDRT